MSTPLAEAILGAISEDPAIVTSWIRMYFRYFYKLAIRALR